MANQEHLDILKQGVSIWNEWRKEHLDIQPDLRGVDLEKADLSGAFLREAHLEGAFLREAHLESTDLKGVHLEGANLIMAHLENANLWGGSLAGANLRGAYFDNRSYFGGVTLGDKKYGYVALVDMRWNDTNLALADWASVKMLGEEQEARQQKTSDGEIKSQATRMFEYQRAVRANRQLATILRDQGLNEEAGRFAYRAQRLQRIVFRRQRKFGQYSFSVLLDLLAGYGYRPLRSLFWYLAILLGFAIAYYAIGHLSLFPPDAFVYSLTSFHGRGFFPGLENKPSLHDPLVMLAAFEAVVGLFIEISFIATFTQRYFGR
jgi:hypothetical protein